MGQFRFMMQTALRNQGCFCAHPPAGATVACDYGILTQECEICACFCEENGEKTKEKTKEKYYNYIGKKMTKIVCKWYEILGLDTLYSKNRITKE